MSPHTKTTDLSMKVLLRYASHPPSLLPSLFSHSIIYCLPHLPSLALLPFISILRPILFYSFPPPPPPPSFLLHSPPHPSLSSPLPSVYLEGQLLKEIQTFFDGYTAIVPSDDKPYRTAKTILFHLTEQMGPQVVLPLVCVCWLVGWLATLFVCLFVSYFVCLLVCCFVCLFVCWSVV